VVCGGFSFALLGLLSQHFVGSHQSDVDLPGFGALCIVGELTALGCFLFESR